MTRRPAVVVGAIVVLAVGILVGVVIGSRGDDTPVSPGTSATAAVVSGSATASLSAQETTSGLPSIDNRDVEMYDYLGGLRLPRSPTAGPRTMEGDLASGFAHSPLGAVLAAVNIAYRTAPNLGAPVYEPTISSQVVGVDKPALLAAARRDGSGSVPKPGQRIAGSDSSLDGWRVDSYSPDQVTMHYLISQVSENGDLVSAAVQVYLRWIDEDWRVIAPAGGDWASAGGPARDTSTYLPFTR